MTGIVAKNLNESSLRDTLRDLMPVSKRFAYFDHAAVGPISRPAADAMRKWVDQSLMSGDVCWTEWASAAARLRSSAASLVGCRPSEIALIPNTTFGINIVSQGFRWSHLSSRQSVVVLENEFSSNLLPWMALSKRGVEVRKVPVSDSGEVSLQAIGEAIDSTTRLVAVSWVGYFSGFRLDLARLCELVHRAGSQLFVDAIQGLGAFPLNTSEVPIDYLAADGHKWMLGPEGAGILFVRESNLEYLEPMMQGWGSLQSAGTFQTANMQLKNDASRYEGGSANHVGMIGLSESLGMLLSFGCNRSDGPLANLVLENAERIETGLQSAGAKVFRARGDSGSDRGLSGILTFEVPSWDAAEVRKRLLDEEIVVSVRHGRLRVATHAYNNEEDIDRLVSTVRQFISHQ